jgi:hypothetical protein
MGAMPEAIDVGCPCCGAQLKVDPGTGAVVRADKPTGPARDLDDLVSAVRSRRSQLDAKFDRSMKQNRNQREILEKKFEEARRKAAEDPEGRPPNPFDYD